MKHLIDPHIYYCLAIPEDDPLKTSPFQGFSAGVIHLRRVFEQVIHLPADVLEPALPPMTVLARRIGGIGGWRCFPLNLKALDEVQLSPEAPFWLVFTADEQIAESVTVWCARQPVGPLHVSLIGSENAMSIEELCRESLHAHIAATLERACGVDMSLDSEDIAEALEQWRELPHSIAPFPRLGHNCTLPNHMTLEAAGITFDEAKPLIGRTDQEYFDAILQSAAGVIDLRRSVGAVQGFRAMPPLPDIILTVPSLYRHAYEDIQTPPKEIVSDPRAVRSVIKMLQRQSSYKWDITKEKFELLRTSQAAQIVIRIRQDELELHTLAVGLRAASTLAATIRLTPGVNRTAGAVRQLASHARSASPRNVEKKTARLFKAVQTKLDETLSVEMKALIETSETGIKLVTDAPLEWLPMGDLPLGLRFDVSRITATPGNLMVGELVLPGLIGLKPEAFRNILLVTAIGQDDPISKFLPTALNFFEKLWRDKFKVQMVEVDNQKKFIKALNTYEGPLLIFDGHGRHSQADDIGKLVIGNDEVNVWDLRGTVRVPPIVVLSACDTHAVDRSHATTTNGFLTLGARTVLGTLLPITAPNAATFIARLIYRLADFVPAAIKVYGRALQWSEIVGGMLRRQFVTDIVRALVQANHLDDAQSEEIQRIGGWQIECKNKDWLDDVIEAVADLSALSHDNVRSYVQATLPLSETIRYVQIGNPETILIGDAQVWSASVSVEPTSGSNQAFGSQALGPNHKPAVSL